MLESALQQVESRIEKVMNDMDMEERKDGESFAALRRREELLREEKIAIWRAFSSKGYFQNLFELVLAAISTDSPTTCRCLFFIKLRLT